MKRDETQAPAAGAAPDLGFVAQRHGDLNGKGLRIGIVVSRYNLDYTAALARDAVAALCATGVAASDIEVAWVPGAYEIPFVTEIWAKSRRFDALIALGCVIRGETDHARLINESVCAALLDIARAHEVPVVDTVVTAENAAQAAARCLDERNGRGRYAAETAVEMARLQRAGWGNL